eukprot:CAMPEP_0174351932 /NCGR_PEP_ID=MMETSP0811_2-20130205/9449_1 /TAXON_ID=73025 ORGANISM="Eutreptiella gymnastica-like, Strain CCMP1594" /NCGR_SAMPLE_ID=MMETSP0811_2 /ASSEMBLY_ACC=CAM_ASM_000667 /LENGTH=85 /DNA_ID=CAMNT_0015481643 /DNA_START=208 /DNA_END=462 /DNA_ORIENTATION=+
MSTKPLSISTGPTDWPQGFARRPPAAVYYLVTLNRRLHPQLAPLINHQQFGAVPPKKSNMGQPLKPRVKWFRGGAQLYLVVAHVW